MADVTQTSLGEREADANICFRFLAGRGPDTLLVHGFASDRLSWAANQAAWEPVGSLYSLDLPGHGDSAMEVGDGLVTTLAHRVAAELDRRHLRNLRLIGHSLGGGVALVLAERRPDLVARLALIAPAGLGEQVDPSFLSAFPTLSNPEEIEALLQRLVARPRLIGKQLVARVLEQLRKPGSREALRRIAEGLAQSAQALDAAAEFVAKSDVPRLVLWGEDDAINPPAHEKLRRFGAEVVFVPAAAHLPQIESPRRVNASIANFLAAA